MFIIAPGVPALHRFCNVIIWNAPTVTGGTLTGYNLRIGSAPSRRFGPKDNFYVTSDADKAANVIVQVGTNHRVVR